MCLPLPLSLPHWLSLSPPKNKHLKKAASFLSKLVSKPRSKPRSLLGEARRPRGYLWGTPAWVLPTFQAEGAHPHLTPASLPLPGISATSGPSRPRPPFPHQVHSHNSLEGRPAPKSIRDQSGLPPPPPEAVVSPGLCPGVPLTFPPAWLAALRRQGKVARSRAARPAGRPRSGTHVVSRCVGLHGILSRQGDAAHGNDHEDAHLKVAQVQDVVAQAAKAVGTGGRAGVHSDCGLPSPFLL